MYQEDNLSFEYEENRHGLFFYLLISVFIFWLVCFFAWINFDKAKTKVIPNNPDYERLVDAIYWAEGGQKAHTDYGISSITCESHADCRQIAMNTVINQHKRWEDAGKIGSYIDSLWKRYAPPEDHPLNKNWKRNVTFYYFHPREVN